MASQSRDELILEGEFLLLSKKKGVHHVTLTRSGLFFHLISNNNTTYKEVFLQMSDIVGCHSLDQIENVELESSSSSGQVDKTVTGDQQTVSADSKNNEVATSPKRIYPQAADASTCGFTVFAYPFRKKLFSSTNVRTRRVLSFEVLSASIKPLDERKKVAETWRNVINCLCRDLPVNLHDIPNCVPPPKGKMLMLINPFSGQGKAYTIFKNQIAPMLFEASIPFEVLLTDHAGHAGELMKTLNLSEWYGVVTVSGDGLIFETINGIMQRDDWASSIKFPFGCLPAGSGNALCCSINYSAGEPVDTSLVLHSTFVLVKHHVVPIDLVALHIPGRTLFSFLSVTWGIVADIDFESEKYRRLGKARFTVGAIKRIIGLRSYRGRISFLPVAEYTPKVNTASSQVLSKIRRVLLHSRSSSRSSSKSTLNSVDSKGSNSSSLSSNKNISQSAPQLYFADRGAGDSFDDADYKNEADISFNAVCINKDDFKRNTIGVQNQSDHLNKYVHFEEDSEFFSVTQGNSENIASNLNCVVGAAEPVNIVDQTIAGSSEVEILSSAQKQIPDSEFISSYKMHNSHLGISQIENVCTSELVQIANGNSEYISDKNSQINNSESHSMSSPLNIGYSVERDKSITILSDAHEVKVEQETYRVRKADFSPVPTPLLHPLDQNVPSNWVTLEENFIVAVAVYQSHLGSDMFAAPDAHLCDGHIHLMMVKEGISRNALLNLFLKFDQGRHIYSPHVDIVKVLAFRFEPASKSGNIVVDGERFDPTPIQGQILPGLARVMAIR